MKNQLHYSILIALATIILFFTNTAISQSWEPTNGPFGGLVTCLANNDNSMFAGTGSGLYGLGAFRSSDDGATWENLNGISNIISMATIGDTLIASSNDGIFQSTNNGDSWTESDYPGTNSSPNAVVTDGTIVYAGGYGGFYVSLDYGLTWIARHNNNFPGISLPYVPDIQSLAFSGSYLYAGTAGKGIYRSADLGLTWATVNSGLGTPGQLSGRSFSSLAVNGNDIFAGTIGQGVFRLLNNGTNWTNEMTGFPAGNSRFIRSLMIKESEIYAGTNGGLFKSNNTGTINWVSTGGTMSNQTFHHLLLKGTEIFSGVSSKGVFVSTDNSSTWSSANYGLSGLSTRRLVHGIGNEIIAATYEGMIYSSTDNGLNWNAGNISAEAGPCLSGTSLFVGTQGDAYRSTDNGGTWELLPQFYETTWGPAYTFLSKGDTIFAGAGSQLGAYYSTDDGNTWNGTSGIWNLNPNGGWPTVLSLTANGSKMYAGTVNGVFKSADNGINWTSCNPAMANIPIMAIVSNSTYIFAGTANIYEDPNLDAIGIYRSGDNGVSWQAVNTGLGNLDIRSLVINGSDIYAGTKSGIYKSTDNGANWLAINDGYPNAPVANSLLVNDNFLFTCNWIVPQPTYRRELSGSVPELPDAIVGAEAPCIGSTQVYSVTNVNEVTYTWQVPADWTINSGNGINSINVTVGTQTGIVLVTPSNGWGTGPAQFLMVTPSTSAEAGINIATDQSTICNGSSVTITATPTEGGDSPVYQWFVNGIENGETGAVLTYVPANNDEIYALLTSSLSCVTNNPVQSNTLQLQVTDAVDVIASIDVDKNDVCAGEIMTFTATTTNGGDQPVYNWYVNDATAGENAPAFAFAPENGDIISLVFTSSEWCVSQNPVTSNAIVAIVNTLPEVSWNYTDPTTVCIEDWGPITLTGGLPEGGVYSGAGVSGNIFDQAVAGAGNHVISYTFTDANNCSNQASIEFIVDECLGITEISSEVLIYPNPASDLLTIKISANQTPVSIRLFNAMGIPVFENMDPKASEMYTIPVQNLPTGNYIIKIVTEHETFVKAVIIN
ncbi:MAG: T9SS type A sorting domain-containing protein [Bacteroidales bacterium]|nr:T9SS type A sorting domain-containing protein [Bacteroidales bacterium]